MWPVRRRARPMTGYRRGRFPPSELRRGNGRKDRFRPNIIGLTQTESLSGFYIPGLVHILMFHWAVNPEFKDGRLIM
jgi:hypothetical protein